MTKKTLPILNKRHVFDIINESRLLREFSLYDCQEVPGKTFGYNPFSGKCVDITDYDGPERPEPVAKQVDSNDDKKVATGASIKDIKDPREAAAQLSRIYLEAFDPDQVIDCYTNNTAFSVLGMFYGKTAVKILPKMAIASAKLGYKTLTSSGKTEKELDAYIKRRQPGESKILKTLTGIGNLAFTVAKSIPKLAPLAGAAGAYWAANAWKDSYLSELIGGSKEASNLVDWVDNKLWGNGSLESWKCFGAGAVLAVSMGLVARKGPRMLMDITKSSAKAGLGIASMLKSPVFRKFFNDSFEKALKNVKSTKLSMFQALYTSGKLPKNIKIIVDKSSGPGTLKLVGLDRVVNIPAEGLPKEFQKFAKDGKITIDPAEINKELSSVSKEVNKIVSQNLDAEASTFSGSDFYKRLKALRAAAKKTGTTSSAAVRSQAMKNSSKILEDLGSTIEESVETVDKIGKQLIKQEKPVKDIVDKLKDTHGISFDNLKKLSANKKSEQEVLEMLDRRFPRLKEEAPKNFKKLSEYFSANREYTEIQKKLVTDIELSRKALLDETGIFNLFSDKSKANDLEDWLNSPAGQKYKHVWERKPFKKAYSIAAGRHILPELRNILKNLASPEGVATFGLTSLVTGLYDRLKNISIIPDIQSISVENIQKYASKGFQSLSLEEFIRDGKIDTKKFLFSAIGEKKLKDLGADAPTIAALSVLLDDPKNLQIIDKYINNREQGVMMTEEDIESRFKNVISTLVKNVEETKQTQTNEVIQMSKKDIKQLVAEVLNENSGMGYGKYPYDIGNSDEQPAEDYIEEWKALAVSLIKDESRDTAVSIAKILVRDLELFEDVLDLAGQNQSVGSEILRKLKEAKEN